jgi:hypothetical protein
MMHLAFEEYLFTLRTGLQHAVKPHDMGPNGLLHLRRKAYRGFLSSLNIHRLGRVSTSEHWVNGKDANHYATEAISVNVRTLHSEKKVWPV